MNRMALSLFLCAVLSSIFGTAFAQRLPTRSRAVGAEVTFNNQIVRIFQQQCQVCHHPGDIGPFSLMSYREALPHARSIKAATQAQHMPPWKPVPGYGEFLDVRRLTQHQIDLIARWVDTGAPEGDPRELPRPLSFPDQWTLGVPDLVIEPDRDYFVPAQGGDIYRCFSIPTQLLEDRHVVGLEVRPGNRATVHHVLLFQDALGLSARLGQPGDAQPGYNCFGGPGLMVTGGFGGWAPGNQPQILPSGIGIRATAGSRVVMQIHYHPSGSSQADRTRVGLWFAREPIQKDYLFLPILNSNLVIPAGAARHTVTASFTIPPFLSAQALSITPHMHLLGREMRLEAIYRDGSRRPLVYIDDWDFQWQGTYYYKEPVPLPAGTRIELTAVYDNSPANPRNPHSPPKEVRWGEQTTDEMCIAFIGFTLN